MPVNERVYYCPVEVSLDKIGGKWKPLVLWHLHRRTRRFGELKRLVPTVTEKMLTATLRQLESDGIVHREVYRQVPPKVEYSLTRNGEDLEGLLQQLMSAADDCSARSFINTATLHTHKSIFYQVDTSDAIRTADFIQAHQYGH